MPPLFSTTNAHILDPFWNNGLLLTMETLADEADR